MEEPKENETVPFNRDMQIGSMTIDHCVDQIRACIKHAMISAIEAAKIRRHLTNFSSKEEAELDVKGIDLMRFQWIDLGTFVTELANTVEELDKHVVAQGKFFIEHIKTHGYMRSKEYWEKISKPNPPNFQEAMDLLKRLTKDAKKFNDEEIMVLVSDLSSLDRAYRAISDYFSFVPTTVDQIKRIYAADHRFLQAMHKAVSGIVRYDDTVYDINYSWTDYGSARVTLEAYERLINAWYNISYTWHDESCF